MKTELQFLTDLEQFSRSGGVNISDVRQVIHTRIEDLVLGYSQDDKIEECPDCHKQIIAHEMTAHGCCIDCLTIRASRFTGKFLKSIENVG